MTDQVDLSIRQFIEAWRLMCAAGPGRTDIADAGVHYIFSGCPIPFFNVAAVSARNVSPGTLKSLNEQACTFASTTNLPWFFVVTEDVLDAGTDSAAIAEGCGMTAMLRLTGMIAGRVAPPAAMPDGLELMVPGSDDSCAVIFDVNSLAYGMDLDAGKDLMGTQAFWRDHFPVVGLTAGRAACTAAVLMVDGCRYVALVATDPAQQRRGYADAAMRRALELSAGVHGELTTVLHATDAGRPVYERMGYTPISTHTLFMEKKFLGGH